MKNGILIIGFGDGAMPTDDESFLNWLMRGIGRDASNDNFGKGAA